MYERTDPVWRNKKKLMKFREFQMQNLLSFKIILLVRKRKWNKIDLYVGRFALKVRNLWFQPLPFHHFNKRIALINFIF